MSKKHLMAGLFALGLGLGASGVFSAPGITPEMAQCIADCQAAGGTRTYCWDCCVRNLCGVE
jgi:hypothetical protein